MARVLSEQELAALCQKIDKRSLSHCLTWGELESLVETIKAYGEALVFYANPGTWYVPEDAYRDGGQRARDALKGG